MKKNYFLYYTLCTALLLTLTMGKLHAQVINKSILYVSDNSKFHIKQGTYTFGATPATTQTTRTNTTYGVFSLGATSTAANPSDDHYVDGFTRYYGTQSLVVPCGDGGVYAPAKIVPTAATGVDVAYQRQNPSTAVSSTLNASVTAISSIEYWKIFGSTPTKMTLSWRSTSGLAALLLTPSLTYVTIVGFDGAQWVEIPSFYDVNSLTGGLSTPTSGSITSISTVNLASFTAFTIGVKNSGTCYPIVASSGNTKTWASADGIAPPTWTPSEPQFNDPVIINAPFTGNLDCYSVELNADITLGNTNVMDVIRGFTGTLGKVIMSSEAILIQRDDAATAPMIEITKITRPMRRFDYVELSSPIDDFATFFADLNSESNTAVEGPDTDTVADFNTYGASPFYNYFTDVNGVASVNVTPSNVNLAQGFAAAVAFGLPPYQISSVAGSWDNEMYPIHIKTSGTTNNGVIPVTLPSAVGWLRLGNPYPSPINALKLLDAMDINFRQTLYFWTFNTPRVQWAVNGNNYTASDYATFNRSGGVAVCPTCAEPNGMIATMQSVYVRKLNPSGAYTFNLNNCLRDRVGNDVFFRTAQEDGLGKFKLNLIGNQSSFSQVMIAYNPQTTVAYDNGYDSARMPGATISELNSLIGTASTGYAIQTRSNFSQTDVVPLQFVNRTQETYTISLASKEGFFTTDPITIYLHDTFANVYHDLALGAYSFSVNSGINNDRFKIVYQSSNLGVGDAVIDNAFATINNDVLLVKANRMIQKVQLFDLTGRLIKTYDNVNNLEMRDAFNKPQSVYLAKITLDNNVVVTQKIINN